MAINVNSNETPNENLDSCDASEVPINHFIDGINSDNEFDGNSSDDSNDNNYELMSTHELDQSSQQITYFSHNYVVNWIDQNSDQNNDQNSDQNSTQQNSEQNCDQLLNSSQTNEKQLSLSDDRINEIKSLMSGFKLPNDNIPLWARNLSEDEWKTSLTSKIQEYKVNNK